MSFSDQKKSVRKHFLDVLMNELTNSVEPWEVIAAAFGALPPQRVAAIKTLIQSRVTKLSAIAKDMDSARGKVELRKKLVDLGKADPEFRGRESMV